jgi:hypothetical protein
VALSVSWLLFFFDVASCTGHVVIDNPPDFRFEKAELSMSLVSFHNLHPTAKPSLLLIYIICGHPRFSVDKRRVPAIGIECDQARSSIDCREAVPYLNFIIEFYYTDLADKYFFAHGHDRAWHFTGNFFDQLQDLQRSEYFLNGTFGGLLHAMWENGPCGIYQFDRLNKMYGPIFAGTSMPPRPIYNNNTRPCCATFWITPALIRQRPREDYIIIRDRLRQWSRDHPDGAAQSCGLLMEWHWHILLANISSVKTPHAAPKEPGLFRL